MDSKNGGNRITKICQLMKINKIIITKKKFDWLKIYIFKKMNFSVSNRANKNEFEKTPAYIEVFRRWGRGWGRAKASTVEK